MGTNVAWLQTLSATLAGGVTVVFFTWFSNKIGRIRILLNSINITYMKIGFDGKAEPIIIPDSLSQPHDFFVCRISFDLLNESNETKTVRDIRYEFHVWEKPFIKIIREVPLNLRPHEAHHFDLEVPYQKHYYNFFLAKKHYLTFLTPRGHRKRLQMSQLLDFVRKGDDKFFTVLEDEKKDHRPSAFTSL